jgi:2-haloacid dehalogenase
MSSPIKAIIFDFGGVLIDWSPHNLYKDYFPDNAAIDAFLEEVDFYNWNAQQDKGRLFAEAVEIQSAKFPHRADLIKAYADNWINSITGVNQGTIDLLYRLKEKGYPIYGLSNWSAETFAQVEGEFAFLRDLDEVVLSGAVKMIKPEPGIFHYLLGRIPEEAKECLFIDDSLPNVQAAQRLEFKTVHFQSAEVLGAELEAFGLL